MYCFRKMKLFIKRLFCNHDKLPENTYHGIVNHVWECSKCGKKFLYYKEFDGYYAISDKTFNDFINECVYMPDGWNDDK